MPESKRRKPRKKQPMTATVKVVIDDEPLEQLEAAQEELQVAQAELSAARERRVSLRLLEPVDVNATPEQRRLSAEVFVDEEDEETLRPLREAVAAAEQAVKDATDTYRFRALGRHAYDELVREHPPTDEDHELTRAETGNEQARAPYHVETFAPALIAACLIEPDLTVDEVKAMWAEWNQAEALELFSTAYAVNQTRRTSSLGKAPGPMWSGVR